MNASTRYLYTQKETLNSHRGPEFESGILKVVVPKWEFKVSFGVYRYLVDAFIAH